MGDIIDGRAVAHAHEGPEPALMLLGIAENVHFKALLAGAGDKRGHPLLFFGTHFNIKMRSRQGFEFTLGVEGARQTLVLICLGLRDGKKAWSWL